MFWICLDFVREPVPPDFDGSDVLSVKDFDNSPVEHGPGAAFGSEVQPVVIHVVELADHDCFHVTQAVEFLDDIR